MQPWFQKHFKNRTDPIRLNRSVRDFLYDAEQNQMGKTLVTHDLNVCNPPQS